MQPRVSTIKWNTGIYCIPESLPMSRVFRWNIFTWNVI